MFRPQKAIIRLKLDKTLKSCKLALLRSQFLQLRMFHFLCMLLLGQIQI